MAISRRDALGGIGALAASAIAARVFGASQAPADAWPQFRGNARLTGVAASALPPTLKLLWSYESGDVLDSSAAIVGGIAYVGAGDGHLVALDLSTGKPRWKYATGTLLGESSPSVSAGTAYIGDMDGIVHAVNIADGAKLWTFKAMSEIKSSPIVVRDFVLIGSYDTHLYALDARTGRVRWKVETKGPVH